MLEMISGGNPADYNIRVDIGGSGYFNETAQIATLDRLFEKGIISDPIAYLNALPDSAVRNKSHLIEEIINERNLKI